MVITAFVQYLRIRDNAHCLVDKKRSGNISEETIRQAILFFELFFATDVVSPVGPWKMSDP